MVQGPTNTVHSGRPGVPHSHLRVGFRDFLTQHWVSSLSLSVSVWTQQLRELLQLNQLNQLATYKSLPPHPTHWKSRSVIPKKKTQSPLASSWSVNQPELCSELCSEDCLTAACLALHLLRASLRGLYYFYICPRQSPSWIMVCWRNTILGMQSCLSYNISLY